jgi:hypothetical protein
MPFTHKLALLSFAGIVALAALPARADDQNPFPSFRAQTAQMANKDGMVTKQDFMHMMEQRFDAMDKGNKGMLTQEQVMRIFKDNTGS